MHNNSVARSNSLQFYQLNQPTELVVINNFTGVPRNFLINMKPVAVLKAKTRLLGKKAWAVSSDCGRMKYSGIDMAFIYVRGKRMLTMSEIARKLYPQWPRTTLYDRMKQMNLRRHTCTAKEIVKVLSVNGVAKQGIHCTLISKEDLDAFCAVYKLNPLASKEKPSSAATGTVGNAETAADKRQSRTQVGPKPKNTRASQKKPFSRAKPESGSRNVLNLNKQRDKSGTRVVKGGRDLGHKRHVSLGINKASNNKQVHVVNKTAAQSRQQHSTSRQLNGLRKRKHSVSKTTEKATPTKPNYGTAKRPRKERITASPSTSDCTSLDSGISVDTPGSRRMAKTDGKSSQKVDKGEPRGVKRKTKSGPKLKDSKLKRDGLKMKDGKLKIRKSGVKSKNGKVKRVGKETGFKKGKVSQCNKGGSDTITKEFIMKMDLKNMNDNDLINSFSLTSSPFSTPNHTPGSEEPSYLVKLMPVKPVWRVNSSFKFISNFLLPPSLVVRDGELKPACSMVCSPGQRPPSAHPVWKWKIGEAVIGNRTEISYRMKKVKYVDSQTK